jgi:hypothetical protein
MRNLCFSYLSYSQSSIADVLCNDCDVYLCAPCNSNPRDHKKHNTIVLVHNLPPNICLESSPSLRNKAVINAMTPLSKPTPLKTLLVEPKVEFLPTSSVKDDSISTANSSKRTTQCDVSNPNAKKAKSVNVKNQVIFFCCQISHINTHTHKLFPQNRI